MSIEHDAAQWKYGDPSNIDINKYQDENPSSTADSLKAAGFDTSKYKYITGYGYTPNDGTDFTKDYAQSVLRPRGITGYGWSAGGGNTYSDMYGNPVDINGEPLLRSNPITTYSQPNSNSVPATPTTQQTPSTTPTAPTIPTAPTETNNNQPNDATPTLYNVDPTMQTVQGQLNGLLNSDSPYIQLARQQAAEQSNSRGLLNSSLAATAGERAAIESAMPIAQQDAQTYFSQANLNQNAENNFQLFNTEFQYNDYFKDKDFNNQTSLNDQQNSAALDLQAAQDSAAMDRLNTQLDTNKLINDANNSIELEKLAQSSDATFSEVTGKIDRQYIDAVRSIMTDSNLSEDSKTILIADAQKLRNNSIVLQGKLFGVDVSVYEDLIPEPEDSSGSGDGGILTDTKTIGDTMFIVQSDGNLRDPNTGEVFTEETAINLYAPQSNNTDDMGH